MPGRVLPRREGVRLRDRASTSSRAALPASADVLGRLTRPGGHLIASGLTASEEPLVMDAFAGKLDLVRREAEDGWIGLTWQRSLASG